MRATLAILVAFFALVPLCAAEMEWLEVAKDGKSFVRAASGKPFVAWGFNYDLDFLCVHLYPNGAKPADDLKTVEAFSVGKPLIIEKTFLLTCTAGQLRQFIDASKTHAAGWIGFYWGKTPAQLRESKDMGDALMLAWLELFQKAAPTPSR